MVVEIHREILGLDGDRLSNRASRDQWPAFFRKRNATLVGIRLATSFLRLFACQNRGNRLPSDQMSR